MPAQTLHPKPSSFLLAVLSIKCSSTSVPGEYTIPFKTWGLEYHYGIGLRTDAEKWIKNHIIYEQRLTNRQALIDNLNLQMSNRMAVLLNEKAINTYNQNYMKNMNEIFGTPDKRQRRADLKFGLGIGVGILLTLGCVAIGGYAVKSYRNGSN